MTNFVTTYDLAVPTVQTSSRSTNGQAKSHEQCPHPTSSSFFGRGPVYTPGAAGLIVEVAQSKKAATKK